MGDVAIFKKVCSPQLIRKRGSSTPRQSTRCSFCASALRNARLLKIEKIYEVKFGEYFFDNVTQKWEGISNFRIWLFCVTFFFYFMLILLSHTNQFLLFSIKAGCQIFTCYFTNHYLSVLSINLSLVYEVKYVKLTYFITYLYLVMEMGMCF